MVELQNAVTEVLTDVKFIQRCSVPNYRSDGPSKTRPAESHGALSRGASLIYQPGCWRSIVAPASALIASDEAARSNPPVCYPVYALSVASSRKRHVDSSAPGLFGCEFRQLMSPEVPL